MSTTLKLKPNQRVQQDEPPPSFKPSLIHHYYYVKLNSDLRWNISGDELQRLMALIKVPGEVWTERQMSSLQSSGAHWHAEMWKANDDSYSRFRRPSQRRRLLPRKWSLALKDTRKVVWKYTKSAAKDTACYTVLITWCSSYSSCSMCLRDLLGVKWETTILRQAHRKTVCAETRLLRKAMYSSTTAWLRPTHGSLWYTKMRRKKM